MLLDNKKNANVGDILKQNIKNSSKLSIISAYFTIYAFAELKKELTRIKELRLLFTTPIYQNNYVNNPLFGESEEIKFKNSLQQVPIQDSSNSTIGTGTIFCLKLTKNEVQTDNYSLEPYYLVYVDENNEVKLGFTSAKTILDIYKNLCMGKDEAINKAVKLFEDETDNYKDMSKYTTQLKIAVESIIGKKEESGMDSLFSRGGTTISSDSFSSIEDFELISYLVIK